MLFTGLDVGDGEAVDGVGHARTGGDGLGGVLGLVAGADALRDLAAGFLGEGARLVGAGERDGFLIKLSRLGVVLLDTGARLVDSK